MDRDSMIEAYRTLMKRQLSQYTYLFSEKRLQGTLNKIARSPEASSLAKELVGGLERLYIYSNFRFSEEGKEKFSEIEDRILKASPTPARDSIEKMLRGDVTASFFTDTVNVLYALEVLSFSGFMRTLSLLEHMVYREFLEEIGHEIERIVNGTLDKLYVQYSLNPGNPPSLTAKAIMQIVKPLARDNFERKLLEESHTYPPLEEDRLVRLLNSAIDAALAVKISSLKGMVYDSFASVGFRRDELDPEVVEIIAYIVKDLLAEIGRHREEVVTRSLEQVGFKLIPKLSHGLLQDHAFYSLFASKMIAIAPADQEEYLAVKKAILKGLWGYELRRDTDRLANLAGQDTEFSVYLNVMRGDLIKMLERLYEDDNIDIETKSKLKLLQAEVLSHYGGLSHMLAEAGCGHSVRLTRLESTRAWLTALVSSLPLLYELAAELSETLKRSGRGGVLIAKVSEDYVKEVLLPGVISIAPIAAYYFDVMEAPILHREDRVCVVGTLMREMITEMSYREVAAIAERLREIIVELPQVEGGSKRRR